jgi:hypothetical protein
VGIPENGQRKGSGVDAAARLARTATPTLSLRQHMSEVVASNQQAWYLF